MTPTEADIAVQRKLVDEFYRRFHSCPTGDIPAAFTLLSHAKRQLHRMQTAAAKRSSAR